MATAMTGLRQRAAWKALERHFESLQGAHLRDLFADDPGRGERLTVEAAGLFLDYSKNRITDETLELARPARRASAASASGSRRCSPASRSTSPRTAPSSTSPCAPRRTR